MGPDSGRALAGLLLRYSRLVLHHVLRFLKRNYPIVAGVRFFFLCVYYGDLGYYVNYRVVSIAGTTIVILSDGCYPRGTSGMRIPVKPGLDLICKAGGPGCGSTASPRSQVSTTMTSGPVDGVSQEN